MQSFTRHLPVNCKGSTVSSRVLPTEPLNRPRSETTCVLRRLRRAVGAVSFAAALVLIAWLPLGTYGVVPFVFSLHAELPLRIHAAAAIAALLTAAWGFWE